MEYRINALPSLIELGKQGENGWLRITIDASAWKELYPNGVCSLIYSRPDGESYPIVLAVVGNLVTWTVSSTDTAVAGRGKAELSLTEGTLVRKSVEISTNVLASLTAGSTPPAASTDWLNTLAGYAIRAEEACDDAEDAAETIESLVSNHNSAVDAHSVLFAAKQNSIADLSVIRTGAAAGATAYQLSNTGIPKSDLSAAVQASLSKADNALQAHQSLTAYRTAAEQDGIDAAKQDTISDLAAIRAGAAAGATALQPSALSPYRTSAAQDILDAGKISTSDYNPETKTASMTQAVGKDSDGKLWTAQSGAEIDDTGTAEDKTWSSSKVSTELSGKQSTANLVTAISGSSTDTQYPSAKAVWTLVRDNVRMVSFTEAVALLNAGARNELVGMQIPDTWTTEDGTVYSDPLDIWDVREVTDTSDVTHMAIIAGRHYASYHAIARKPSEGVVPTEATAQSGVYYYGQTSSSAEPVGLNLAEGDAVPYDSYYRILKYDLSVNRCLPNTYEQGGRNRYAQSAAHQYLNSNAVIGQWWVSKHVGDVAPSNAATTRGYLAGCSNALLSAAREIKKVTYNNTYVGWPGTDTITGKVFLPSVENLMGAVYSAYYDVHDTAFLYWKQATGLTSATGSANVGRIVYRVDNHSAATDYYTISNATKNSYTSSSVYVKDNGYCDTVMGYAVNSSFHARRYLPYIVLY